MSRSKITVLHLMWDGDLGGVQRYAENVLFSPFWKDVKHVLCFFRTPGQILNEKTLLGMKMYSLFLNHGWEVWKVLKLSSVIKKEKIDLIHCHCDTLAFQCMMKRFLDQALIYTDHGDLMMRTKRDWLNEKVWGIRGRLWDYVLFNSKFTMENFIQRFPKIQPRCEVLLNPLLEEVEPKKWNEVQENKIGLFCRLVPQKGVDWFIEMAKEVHEKNREATFHIFGEGPLKQNLMDRVHQLDLSSILTFHGFTKNPLENMRKMTCIVVPSRIEPFGLSALEAQSVGVPVVAFQESGVGEIVKNEKTGFLVPHGDIQALSTAVLKVMETKGLAKQLGETACLWVRDKFSLEKHIERLSYIYHQALTIKNK